MDSAGMMKMATGEGSPLWQGAGKGSREVFGGYRGLRRRNSRSIFCSGSFMIRRYIWVQGVRRWSFGGPMRQGGALGGAPLPSWAPRGFLDGGSKSPGSYLMRKSRSKKDFSAWTLFDIPFLRNTEIGIKQQIWAGPPVNRLVPKII